MRVSALYLKTALFLLMGVIISKVFGYAFQILIARTDQALYGSYSLAFAIITFIIPFVVLGLNTALIREISYFLGKKDIKGIDKIISTSIIIVLPLSVIVFSLLYFNSNLIASFFKVNDLSVALRYLSILIPILALSQVFSSILTSNKEILGLTLSRDVLQSISEFFIALLMVTLGFRLGGVAFALIISYSLSVIVLFKLSKRFFNFRVVKIDYFVLSFSVPLLIVLIISDLISKISTIVLGHFVNAKEVALYSAALPTSQMIIIFATSLLGIFLPTITEKFASEKKIDEDYHLVMKWVLISTLPAAGLLIIFSNKIMEVFFGTLYSNAATSLSILGAGYLVFSLSRPAFNLLLMLKKTKIILGISLCAVILDIFLCFILIPLTMTNYKYGIYGAAISVAVSIIVLSILTFIYAYKHTKIKLFDKKSYNIFLAVLLSLAPIFLIRLMVKNQSLLMVILYFILFSAIYLFLLVKLECFDEEDRKMFMTVRRRFG